MTPDGPGTGPGPHVFVADLSAPDPGPEDRHHLERVLRLRRGDELTMSDGRGGWCRGRYGPGVLEITTAVVQTERPTPVLTVGFALTKGSKPELAVQKLTEIGIDVIVPFVAARSVVRWDDDKAERQVERFRRVAHEAAMQCRRTWLPRVEAVARFADVAVAPAVVAAPGGTPLSGEVTVLVGPEGGWTVDEAAACPAVDLGPHVLRAETAAIVAAALLVHAHRR